MKRLLAAALFAVLLLPAAAQAAGLPDFDVRDGAPAPTLVRPGRALSSPSGAGVGTIARRFLAARGFATAQLGPARVVTAPGGLRTVRFNTFVDGIPSYDSGVTVGLDRAGRVLTVAGRPVRLSVGSTTPRISAAAALARFSAPMRGLPETATLARLVVFAMPHGADRLAWHVYAHGYDGVVDARTGSVLRRHSTIRHAAAANVFPNYPGAAAGGTATPVDLEAAGWLAGGAPNLSGPFVHAYTDTSNDDTPDAGDEITRTAGGDFAFTLKPFSTPQDDRCKATTLSPTPVCVWDSSQVSTYTDNLKQTTVQTFYLDNTWHDHLQAAPIGFDAASGNFAGNDPVQAQTDDSAASYVNIPLVGLVVTDPTGGVNNANMSTPPDGTPPTMQMYLGAYDDAELFGLFRDYNNGDDAATVFHEYTHGLTSRLVTNADGTEALDSDQAGAMGEDWSDWYAFDYLVRKGLSPDTAAPSEVDIGIYSDAARHATRTQGLDCPVSAQPVPDCPGAGDAGPGGYTYGDFGKISGSGPFGGPEVHADGEIWGETLWDLRSALVTLTGSQAEGSDIAEAIVTGGLRLSPPEPSFLDERDAIIQADVGLYGGAHVGLIWSVFAARGMGTDASTTGGSDDAPKEGFKVPEATTLAGSLSAPSTAATGATVTFDASSFGTASTYPKGYAWDFDGDGKADAHTEDPTTTHVYTNPGTFTARVIVTDTHAATGTATATIKVTGAAINPTPTPTATGSPTATPTATATPAPGSVALRFGRTTSRGRYAVIARCDPSCAVRVNARLAKKTAAALGVKPRLAPVRQTVRGTVQLRIALNAKLLQRARARHVRTLSLIVTATATPPGGKALTRRHSVRVRT